MAEIMEPDRWQTCASQQLAKLTEVIARIDRGANRSREHASAISPERPGSRPFLSLPGAVILQRGDELAG